jgi:hypothetical protein
LDASSGTQDQFAARLVEGLADDPQLLATVLGKLLAR